MLESGTLNLKEAAGLLNIDWQCICSYFYWKMMSVPKQRVSTFDDAPHSCLDYLSSKRWKTTGRLYFKWARMAVTFQKGYPPQSQEGGTMSWMLTVWSGIFHFKRTSGTPTTKGLSGLGETAGPLHGDSAGYWQPGRSGKRAIWRAEEVAFSFPRSWESSWAVGCLDFNTCTCNGNQTRGHGPLPNISHHINCLEFLVTALLVQIFGKEKSGISILQQLNSSFLHLDSTKGCLC